MENNNISGKKIQNEKEYLLDILKANDCESLKELQNLINFLNNENKRLHSLNIENLKRINILSARINHLENLTKDNSQHYECETNYKYKFMEVLRAVNIIKKYTKDKENEYNEMVREHEKYSTFFFLNLNKIIDSIIIQNNESNVSNLDDILPTLNSHTKNNERNYSHDKTKMNRLHSSPNLYHHSFKNFDNYWQCLSVNDNNRMGNAGNAVNNQHLEPLDCGIYKENRKSSKGEIKKTTKKKSEQNISNGITYHLQSRGCSNEIELKNKLHSNYHSPFHKNLERNDEKEIYNTKFEKMKSLRESYKNTDNELISSEDNINKKKKKKNFEAENQINKMVNYNYELKNIDIKNTRKDDIVVSEYNLNKDINSPKENIINILNKKKNITPIKDIGNLTPKYVKYNTLHREIVNPRQRYSRQKTRSIDHIICL
ncbi:conserved Plasmodium protein, unknown function [Plasmodium berghei]|uniref:Uncharacterized protein n=2 Tax=Plasmodium berghei TaxID=5821 RepID=A0A509AJI7_PLABA|nr:conserved Plasmodium protein, unknown function [Plasmodium berghei ANKA]CXI41195.1 conserved Plasmodium protein, unknown function [Plasmodium berghei]SCM21893.1 conserved Plasmodium protein, unknown function [Plasmodium berghei]SCN25137.1 conserved Plasmodium protein, unknown function [Plasmodium berghei]SCO60147.1 conserved Plasmodium protein, unknown function [Plasmodium berghei]SCO61718.1 conserved Plasmodium protein, unknown function [Plasmodium berghei]|eukprot:XP_034421462.1 conserved Plasmodium protein, unknown function [Plasmodium berghei ANKA]